jgi:hypothetical protein
MKMKTKMQYMEDKTRTNGKTPEKEQHSNLWNGIDERKK